MDLLIIVIALIILWVIISIPAYIAGKIVTAGKSTFGEAMLATLFGPIVYAIVLLGVSFFLGTIIGSAAYVLALILALIAWVWVYKATFRTGWLGGIAIAILAFIIFVIIGAIIAALFGVTIPSHFFPKI
ncbi:MAG TPA: hypothetical protein VK487_10945 [Candidatus Bathyarchaeia archaeon]|nr:hypothetical protein [Candidatus Bathyarchaeia archaeon]